MDVALIILIFVVIFNFIYYQSIKNKIITKEIVDIIFSGNAKETAHNLYIGDIITYIIERWNKSGGGGSGETGGFSDKCNSDASLGTIVKIDGCPALPLIDPGKKGLVKGDDDFLNLMCKFLPGNMGFYQDLALYLPESTNSQEGILGDCKALKEENEKQAGIRSTMLSWVDKNKGPVLAAYPSCKYASSILDPDKYKCLEGVGRPCGSVFGACPYSCLNKKIWDETRKGCGVTDYQQGHIIGDAAMKGNYNSAWQTYSFCNIGWQTINANHGSWIQIEDLEAQITDDGTQFVVVTGPLPPFGASYASCKALDDTVANGWWKIIKLIGGSSYVFIWANRLENTDICWSGAQKNIDYIEKQTGFKLPSALTSNVSSDPPPNASKSLLDKAVDFESIMSTLASSRETFVYKKL